MSQAHRAGDRAAAGARPAARADAAGPGLIESRLPSWVPARFVRFGVVGGLGTVVNLVVLWLAQEWLLAGIQPASLRLNVSLALSIAVSTVHNFAWNRRWTWHDRRAEARHGVVVQFAQYALACWFGILLQFIFTRLLADEMHYMLAATLAIGVSSVANFAVNDFWTFGQRLLAAPSIRRLVVFHAALVVLTVWAYGHGLGSRFIPKNGDEYVYVHITRLTAATGHWLPLASDLEDMRNTKPPLLFWQGVASSDRGARWTLADLRWPSLVYTLLTALAIGAVTARLARDRRGGAAAVGFDATTADASTMPGALDAPARGRAPTVPRGGFAVTANAAWTFGVAAALVWLGFFTTFRYGRPFLTNAPETFWLAVPLLAMLAGGTRVWESRLAVPLALGVAIGVGLLYKSFALLAPVAVVLALWWLDHRQWRVAELLRRDALKLGLVAATSLGLFAVWFALDPDPAAIWREFVIGENVGKLGADAGSAGEAIRRFFWGSSSVWAYAVAGLGNAGLWFGVVAATLWVAWRRRAGASAAERRLWIWLAVFAVVFAIPSQRSARYLIPALPALAVLVALHWRDLPRWAFAVGHGLALGLVVVMMWLALGLQDGSSGAIGYRAVDWAVMLLAATVCLAGLALPALTRGALLAAVPLTYGVLATFLHPLDGPAGRYAAEVQQRVAGQAVWVPCNFRGRFEDHGFLLPGAQVRGYAVHEGPLQAAAADPARGPEALAERYPLFAWRQPLSAPPPRCEGCTVLASRVDLKSRHSSREIREMLAGRVQENLYLREWLIAVAPRPSHALHAAERACR